MSRQGLTGSAGGEQGRGLQPISDHRHRFPADIIRHATWLSLRFTLSDRDVEELLAERGLDVSDETVRRWVLKFGPLYARNLRRQWLRPSDQWPSELITRRAYPSLRHLP